MIYLKQLFSGRTTPLLIASLVLLLVAMQVESSKIAYKKPIQGKANAIKENQVKTKTNEDLKSTTKQTPVAPLVPPPPTASSAKSTTTTTTAATTIHDELEVAETTHEFKTELSTEEKPAELKNDALDTQQQIEPTIDETNKQHQSEPLTKDSMEFQEVASPVENIEENQLEQEQQKSSEKSENKLLNAVESQERSAAEEPINTEDVTTVATTTTVLENSTTATIQTPSSSSPISTDSTIATTDATTPSNRPVPCTCGVFMTSQIKRTGNPYESPTGRPVIINELDRTYPCSAVGQKQCQTKCLETIVQHLPNSANILCASLDHDIRKERAYLFIKNCRNQWFNTNLAAGREYCCKNGQPYQCPLV